MAAETPAELRGQFIYPSDPEACKYQNYALTVTASVIEANEFACKVNRVSRQGADYVVNATCSSEDGRATKNMKMRVEGGALVMGATRYLRCDGAKPAAAAVSTPVESAQPAAAPAPEGAPKLPGVCRDDDLKGGPKKIYADAALKRVSKDHDSSGMGFLPQQAIVAGIHPAFRGTIFSLRTGRDAPGVFYVNANEWRGLCQ